MTRLFLRFYLGILLILFTAWLIQAFVFRRTAVGNNITVVENALGGGTRLARDQILDGGLENLPQTLAYLQSKFDFPSRVVERSEAGIPPPVLQRLDAGEVVLHGTRMKIALPETNLLLEMGPLPQFSGPSQAEITVGLGSVFLFAALAIAILLRPLANQLRSVERAALAIVGGDLSARIGHGQRRLSVPFAGAFNSMADRVEHLLRSQRELLQAVSHELRTPLSRIKFATELLHSADDQAQRERRIVAIDEATDQLDALVGELLTYVRLDADTEVSECELVEIDSLLCEAIAIHAPLYPDKQFVDQVSDPELCLQTFRLPLLRAIGNLLSNAGKYSRSRVQISAQQQGGSIQVTIDDDGPGIGVEDRDVIFEPFKRLSDASQPGTGLGLALVRRICRRLGGDISVTESPLGGASFTISVPISFVVSGRSAGV